MKMQVSAIKKVRFRLLSVIMSLMVCATALYAERVGKILYKGHVENLSDTTLIVPYNIVALTEHVYVGHPDSIVIKVDTPSIFFIIDHSGSMYEFDYDSATNTLFIPKDTAGNRFRVVRDLVDTLSNAAKFPGVEVGVAVFGSCLYYDTSKNNMVVAVAGEPGIGAFDRGGYIPLLKLGRDYNGKTGATIIKELLTTKKIQATFSGYPGPTIKYQWDDLVAPREFFFGGSTNINIGFIAAKKAMRSSTYMKENHYCIFVSDGDANGGMNAFDFVKGIGVPTTYTVFFTDNGQAPQNLQTMNSNIKINGYSTSNPLSTLWPYENTTYENLKKFLMKNVISIFEQNTSIIPKNIQISGIGGNIVWDGEKFILPSVIPLTGKTTDFAFNISYTIKYDSINANGDTVHIVIDTTITTKFSAEVDYNMTIPVDTTCKAFYWDRTLKLYYNNNQISVINDENMNTLQLQFAFSPGDAQYNYSKAQVEVTNANGIQKDKETFQLVKQGATNLFLINFNRAVNPGGITPGDGVLQHYSSDTLIAVFRNSENPKLPLDTLRITIPIRFPGIVTVEKAYYYDTDANGYVDSIHVKASNSIEGGMTGNHVAEIVGNAITLPAFRGFTVNGSGVTSDGFYIKVVESTSHNPVTYVTPSDLLKVSAYTLASGGKIEQGTFTIHDRVAPIIHWAPRSALLFDYRVASKSDTLAVTFSEPVKDILSNEPFYFLNHTTNTNYVVTLSAATHPQPDNLVFHVASVAGAMQDGDSLWIHETNLIADSAGNFQNNTLNIKRRLYVDLLYGPITIECGYYYDTNADGYVDSIYVKAATEIEGGLTDARVQEIVQKAIVLPAFRGFTVSSSGVVTGGFFAKVTENRGHNPFTYITPDDKLIVSACVLSMGGEVSGGTLPMYDRVAPLIHWEARAAYLVDYMDPSKTDALSVKFSEPITGITHDQPFLLLRVEGNTPYTATMAPVSLDTDKNSMKFTVQSIGNNMERMRDGDSIWIQQTNRVGDAVVPINYQNDNNNTRRRLYVERIAMPYEFVPQAVSPVSQQSLASNYISAEIITVLGSDLPGLNLQKNQAGQYCGMIIMVVPDPENIGQFVPDLKVQGTMTILDAVGNTVVLKQPLSFWDKPERKSLVTVWNLKNRNGRVVGPGMYVCLFEIEDITETLGYQNNPQKQVKKITIGVK